MMRHSAWLVGFMLVHAGCALDLGQHHSDSCESVCAPASSAVPIQRFAYVTQQTGNSITVLRIEPDGAASTIQTISTGPNTMPISLSTDPEHKLLFTANAGVLPTDASISVFAIHQTEGRLTFRNRILLPVGTSPVNLSTDHTGHFLFVAGYGAGNVSVYRFNSSGVLTYLQTLATGALAHSVLPDPSNRFVYVPNVQSNTISIFGFSMQTYLSTPVNNIPTTGGPRIITFHPSLPMAYVSNENGDTVTSFSVNSNTGSLINPVNQSTLPSWPGLDPTKNYLADVRVTPSGRFLYVTNRYVDNVEMDSIAVFSLNPSGAMSAATSYVYPGWYPQSLAIDSSEDFLLVANNSLLLGDFRVLAMNPVTGSLSERYSYSLGGRPNFVIMIELPVPQAVPKPDFDPQQNEQSGVDGGVIPAN